jgi:hypothetical protein
MKYLNQLKRGAPFFETLLVSQLVKKFLAFYRSPRLVVVITKLRGLSPQENNYTHRATAAVGEVVPTFAGRECYVVSATDSHGR